MSPLLISMRPIGKDTAAPQSALQRKAATGRRTPNRTSRSGLTLLEVILAIAILGASMAAIGELVRMGSRSAKAALELNQAQIICQSKLAEVTAGIAPAQPILDAPYEFDPDWLYSIETAPLDQQPGLIAVRVSVKQNVPAAHNPVAFSLIRWIPDPDLQLSAEGVTQTKVGSDTTMGGTTP